MIIVVFAAFVLAVIKILIDSEVIKDLEKQIKCKQTDLEMSRINVRSLEGEVTQLANSLADLKAKYVRPRDKNGRFTR